MISGIISVYPRFGKETYVESKTKQVYRHLPCTTPDGLDIHITVKEEIYLDYIEEINGNVWGNTNLFRVWGEVKSVNHVTEGFGLSNLYLRVDRIEKEEGVPVNLFSLNGHGTKTVEDIGNNKYYWIAANKNILNKDEKKNKPTYCYLKTNSNVSYLNKDIIQGTVRLIQEDNQILLESIYTNSYTSCRKLVEFFIPKERKIS